MARPKRTLAEADVNTAPTPTAKRTSRAKTAQGKENNASTTSKDGKKTAKVSPPAAKAAAPKRSAKPSSKDASATWICVCPAREDLARELGIDPDDDDDTDERIEESCGGNPNCLCKKPADNHPEHKWILTKAGFDLYMKWVEQREKRDQDNFGMHIYNDFTGYGVTEVMQNMLVAFNTELNKKTHTALTLWPHVEAMAWFLDSDLDTWRNDDSDSMADVVAMLGTALLTTIDTLIAHYLFKKDSSIRNVGLVIAQWLRFTLGEGDDELCVRGENNWKHAIVRLADKHGFEITGIVGIENLVKTYRLSDMVEGDENNKKADTTGNVRRIANSWKPEKDYDEEAELRTWKEWDWKIEFAEYRKKYRIGGSAKNPVIGGSQYDITKMPKTVRMQYDLDRD